jgi:hypothetical protein
MKTWLEDVALYDLGCQSHSCKYVKPTGMATNGRCSCAHEKPSLVERFLGSNYELALAKIKELEKSID